MADLPIINNLRDKLIPNRNNDDEDDFDDINNGGHSPEQDVLEQYRIALNTELEDEILTPSKLSKVKFSVTQPKGFSFKQVEVFHNEVSKSVQWYIQALEKRDRDVHKLATEVDKYKTDMQNARFQLEVLQGVGGQAVVDDSGEYVTESQMSQDQLNAIALENRVSELENDLKYERRVNLDLQAQVEAKNSQPPAPAPVLFPPLSKDAPTDAELAELADLRERQVELDAWEAEVVAEYERIENELETTKALLGAKETELATLRAELDKATEALRAALSEAESMGENSTVYADTIATLEAQISSVSGELREALGERDEIIGERDAAMEELETLRSVEPAVVADESLVAELDEARSEALVLQEKITGLDEHISELETYSDTIETALAERDAALVESNKLLEDYLAQLAEKDRVIAEKERLLEEQSSRPGYSGGERIPGYRLPEGITAEDLGLE